MRGLTFPRSQLFPGLIYRMVKPKVVLLIFVSGKIVLTGAKVRRVVVRTSVCTCRATPDPLSCSDHARAATRRDLSGFRSDLPGPERVPQALITGFTLNSLVVSQGNNPNTADPPTSYAVFPIFLFRTVLSSTTTCRHFDRTKSA